MQDFLYLETLKEIYSRYNLKNDNSLLSLSGSYEVWWLHQNFQTWDKIKDKNIEYEIERQNQPESIADEDFCMSPMNPC